MKLSQAKTAFVRNAIDIAVTNTGFPVLGSILEKTDVATRRELRSLAQKGLLKAVRVSANGTHYTAYHTERMVPKAIEATDA